MSHNANKSDQRLTKWLQTLDAAGPYASLSDLRYLQQTAPDKNSPEYQLLCRVIAKVRAGFDPLDTIEDPS